MRVTGGRTVVWGRQSYRMGDLDFKAASHDGFGEDWPLSYADLVPYYDLVEDYVGISGPRRGGLRAAGQPASSPAMALNCAETPPARGASSSRLGLDGDDRARGQHHETAQRARAPATTAARATWGCVTNSYFNSAFTTVADALATGRCTHVAERDGPQGPDGPGPRTATTGLLYVDRVTREPKGDPRPGGGALRAGARVCPHPPQLGEPQHPSGLGNSSGALGHYLMDHLVGGGRGRRASSPGSRGRPSLDGPTPPERHLRHPLPQHEGRARARSRFLRGYGYQGGAGTELQLRARRASKLGHL